MSWPKASDNLHAYLNWRKSLVPFPNGTILRWVKGYKGTTLSTSIKSGQHTPILNLREPFFQKPPFIDADMVYDMVLCTSKGKPFKMDHPWSVEGIAARITDGEVVVVQ